MAKKSKDKLTEFVEKFKNGDEEAFHEIYLLTKEKAFYLAFSILKNRQDAEDILQESYVSMVKSIGTLRETELFISWFDSIVANKAKDLLRKRARDRTSINEILVDQDSTDHFVVEERIECLIEKMTISELINKLTEEKRQVIIYYYFCDYSIKDISRLLQINEATVRSRIFQARKDLAKLICFEKK